MSQPTHAIVSIALLNRLVTYLQRKPYAEVAGLLADLSVCEPHVPPSDEAEEPSE